MVPVLAKLPEIRRLGTQENFQLTKVKKLILFLVVLFSGGFLENMSLSNVPQCQFKWLFESHNYPNIDKNYLKYYFCALFVHFYEVRNEYIFCYFMEKFGEHEHLNVLISNARGFVVPISQNYLKYNFQAYFINLSSQKLEMNQFSGICEDRISGCFDQFFYFFTHLKDNYTTNKVQLGAHILP